MTFKQLLEAQNTLKKVFNSTKITDFDEAVIIAEFQEGIEKALKLLEAGQKALVKPYEDKAKERATEASPNGFNTQAEMEEFNVLKDEHFEKDIPMEITVPKLKEDTIKAMFSGEGEMKLTPLDIRQLKAIGIM
jgi:hypothetical protein